MDAFTLHKCSTALTLITTLAYESSFSEKVFLDWDPLKSSKKKFGVGRTFLMSALSKNSNELGTSFSVSLTGDKF